MRNIHRCYFQNLSYFANPFFTRLRTINDLSAFLLSCRSSSGESGVKENANNIMSNHNSFSYIHVKSFMKSWAVLLVLKFYSLSVPTLLLRYLPKNWARATFLLSSFLYFKSDDSHL